MCIRDRSKDMGVGALYFSQQAVARLAPRAGFQFEGMPFPEQLKKVQALSLIHIWPVQKEFHFFL